MNEITNHAELTVERAVEGQYKKQRTAMKFAYWVIFPALFVIILSVLVDFLLALIAFCVYPMLHSKVVKPSTYHLVDQEQKMDISGGTLTLSTIYGKKKQKILVKMRVCNFDAIVPYKDEYKAECDAFVADRRYECVSTMSHPDVYCAYGTNDYEERIICFFEATTKGLRVLKFLNKNTVVTEVSR